ncbi:MAG: hypothetical protein WCQ16_05905 [Verrucomicrobiae bacterium]
MKTSIGVLLAVIFSASSLCADSGYSFGITKAARKVSAEKQMKAGLNLAKEEWVYDITIENKSFKDVQNIDIKYIIFEKTQNASDVGKTKQEMVRKQGEKTVPAMKNLERITFATESIERTNIQLKPGYVWKSGSGKRQSKDSMSGIWLRIFVNGQQVMELMDPPTLSADQKWNAQ